MEIRLERYVKPKNKSISWYVFIWLYYQNTFFSPSFCVYSPPYAQCLHCQHQLQTCSLMEVELLEEILGLFFLPYFSFLFKIYLFQLEDNFFIILCWFLPYININQPSVYICPLPGGSMVKYLIANAGDTGLTPVAGTIPWRRKW